MGVAHVTASSESVEREKESLRFMSAVVVLVLIDRFLSTREKAMTEKEGKSQVDRNIMSGFRQLCRLVDEFFLS